MNNKRQAMDVEEILKWLDIEIADLKDQYTREALLEQPNKLVLIAIQGTVRYLDGMKAKLMDATFDLIDRRNFGA